MKCAPERFAIVPCVLLLCGALVWPVLLLARCSLLDTEGAFVGLANFMAYFSSPGLVGALRNTLFAGVVVTAVTLVAAFALAYGMTCACIRGRGAVRVLFMAPLFAPSIMPAMGLIYLFGAQGIVCSMDLYGLTGIVLGFVILALPQATLQIALVLRGLDRRQILAARSLGASAVRRFFSVVLPHARHGLIRAGAVSFVLTITDFGVPTVMGGEYATLATEIYKQAVGQHDFGMGAVSSLVLTVPAMAVFALDWRARQALRAQGGAAPFVPARHKARDLVLTGLCWAIVLAELAVLTVVVWGSFIAFWPYDFTFTLANYGFEDSVYGLRPFFNSFVLAILVSVFGTVLIYGGAYLAVRIPGCRVFGVLYRALAVLPLCLPGTVLGLAYIFAYGASRVWDGMIGGFVLLILNTVIHQYTVPHLSCVNALEQIDRRYEDVGRTLGVPVCMTFWRVILPLNVIVLIETAFYLFSGALTTISAVVFLYNPETIPASIATLQLLDSGSFSQGSAMATLLLACSAAVRLLLLRCARKRDR